MNLSRSSAEANSVRPEGRANCVVQAVGDRAATESEDAVNEEIKAEEVEEYGERLPVRVHDPALPGRAEIEQHMLTHVPFRSWCEHCVKGRGEEAGHPKGKDEAYELEMHMDFCFMGEEKDSTKLTILVVRERRTRMTMSSVTPTKGDNEFLAKRLMAFLREIGADKGDIVVKTDQEPAMLALLNELARHRAAAGGGRVVPEHSPVGDSQSNGVVERAIKSVEGQIRVAKSALEGRTQARSRRCIRY